MPTSEQVWLAFDPGWRETGIVLRRGADLLGWAVITREADEDLIPGRGVQVGAEYVRAVIHGGIRLIEQAFPLDGEQDKVLLRVGELWALYPRIRVAAEGIVTVKGRVKRKDGAARLTDPGYAMGAAIVLGGIVHAFPDVVVCPPPERGGGHGDRILASYPSELITTAERRHGLGRTAPQNSDLRHARSAWDLVDSARYLSKVRASKVRTAAVKAAR